MLAACGAGDRATGAGGANNEINAADLYARACTRCHGPQGRGAARLIKINPRIDLSQSPLARAGDRDAVRTRIAKGFGPMPGFAHLLTPAELDALTTFSMQLLEAR